MHLDGSIRLSTLISVAEENKDLMTLPYYTEEELRQHIFKDHYENLEDYLNGFQYILAVMRCPDALERCAYEFAVDNYEENVTYFEVRFAPQLLANDERDVMKVLQTVNHGLRRAKDEYNKKLAIERKIKRESDHKLESEGIEKEELIYDYGIIVCAMRMFLPDFSPYYSKFCALHCDEGMERIYELASIAVCHTALRAKKEFALPVVGIDIAGAEAGFPAKTHKETFHIAHKNFMFKTCHSGEDWGPESIFQAITDLHVERIGHGYNIFATNKCSDEIEDPEAFVGGLVDYVAQRRIMLEVCLTSNLQTMPYLRDAKLKEHTFKRMLEYGLCVTLNTDNRLVSNTSVTNEILLAIDNFPALTPKILKSIVLEGFKRSFYPGTFVDKRDYLEKMTAAYESIEEKYQLV